MATRNPKNFEFKLGKQGLLLLVAGMSLLLFAVFLIGLMVGVHLDAYPEKIAQGIPAIIRRQLSHPPVVNEKVAAAGEVEKFVPAKEEGNIVAIPPDSPIAKDDLPVVAAGPEEKKTRPTAPTDAGGEATPPQVPAAATPKVAADAAPVVARGKYSVQVGSFKSKAAANRFGGKITALGFKPRVEMVELRNKGSWFRVMVDGFASRGEAKQAVGVLAKKIKGVNGIIRSVH